MTEEAKKLLKHIVDNIGIKKPSMPNYYHSLPICILDDIFSLQSKYETITFPTVKKYADYFLNGDLYTSNYSIDSFIDDLKKEGLVNIMTTIIKNK